MTLLDNLLSTVFERRDQRETPNAPKAGRPLTNPATALVEAVGQTSGLSWCLLPRKV